MKSLFLMLGESNSSNNDNENLKRSESAEVKVNHLTKTVFRRIKWKKVKYQKRLLIEAKKRIAAFNKKLDRFGTKLIGKYVSKIDKLT